MNQTDTKIWERMFADASEAKGTDAAERWLDLAQAINQAGHEYFQDYSLQDLCELALAQLKGSNRPELVAEAHFGIGSFLCEQGLGHRDEYLKKAVSNLDIAIELYNQLGNIEGEAEARYYRGYAWSEFIGPERYQHIERSIAELENLPAKTSYFSHPDNLASFHNVLGSAYSDRTEGDPRQNFKTAADHFRKAIRVFRRENNGAGEAQALINLAHVLGELSLQGDDTANDESLRALKAAQKATQLADMPIEVQSALMQNIAKSFADRGGRQWKANLRKAVQIAEEALAIDTDPTSSHGALLRLTLVQFLNDLTHETQDDHKAKAKELLDRIEPTLDPVETTEWWLNFMRQRAFLALLNQDSKAMAALARSALDQTENVIRDAESFADQANYLALLAYIVDLGILGYIELEEYDQALDLAWQVHGRTLGLNDTAVTLDKHRGQEIYLLNTITRDWTPVLRTVGRVVDCYHFEGVDQEFWHRAQDLEIASYFSATEALSQPGGIATFKEHIEIWIDRFSGTLGPLCFDLMEDNATDITLFAFGGWATVPFAALQMPGPESTQLIDHIAHANGPRRQALKPLVLGSCLHVFDDSLDESPAEAAFLVDNCANVKTISDQNSLYAALSGDHTYDLIHFSTHGSHDFAYLEGAGIKLPGNEVLTARWVHENARLDGLPLVCLASCQSGIPDFEKMPHEAFGLSTAFLSAGARAVVSTLWPVDDLATRFLIQKLYAHAAAGHPLPEALRLAQVWLRDTRTEEFEKISTGSMRFINVQPEAKALATRPFAHPYYWAGFTLHLA